MDEAMSSRTKATPRHSLPARAQIKLNLKSAGAVLAIVILDYVGGAGGGAKPCRWRTVDVSNPASAVSAGKQGKETQYGGVA